MRILLLCDRYPFPLHNGQNLRIYHYVRSLLSKHLFDLACYGDSDIPPPLESLFHKIVVFPRPQPKRKSFRAQLHGMFSIGLSHQSQLMIDWLRQHMSSQEYDLVWMSGWDTVVNLPPSRTLPFIADIVDDGIVEHWRELRTATHFIERVRMGKRLVQNALFERRYFCPADACIVVSELDANILRRVCSSTPVYVIHNGVDENYFHPFEGDSDPATIVFEGSMEFKPNVDAACFLIHDILPRVQLQVPEAKVILVGRDPAPAVRVLAGDNVTITGFVEDVRPYLARATVFVCPMRKGAGIKNKILQAWAMSKAVIASPIAAGGLVVREGENILIRAGAEAIAEAIVGVIRDRRWRQHLGQEGRKTICAHYTWMQKAEALDAVFQAVASLPQRDGGKHGLT